MFYLLHLCFFALFPKKIQQKKGLIHFPVFLPRKFINPYL
ncbi:hypothetical protein HMPREF0373_03322 [Eubacterium ramulus ATCC 29099]|uniref:Uncharacterized protein n=1 Tax=Eubacterium ramulus ATCC 29099 TaxID=1256908 RepID=U2NSN6_EUBRA|nr:hypothetical protein HMPREF0373_03322 [Eubacterium ramulus ATCC 29099]